MITVYPYVEVNGKWSFPDSVVESIFCKIVQDGSFEYVFYEGDIKNLQEFKTFLKNKNNYPVFILVDGIVQSIAWINFLERNHCLVHFCVFKESWGKNSIDMGKAALKYWFDFKNEDGSPLLEVILGTTPSNYKSVLKFIKNIGFTIVGEIPKISYNVYKKRYSSVTLSYCERSSWADIV